MSALPSPSKSNLILPAGGITGAAFAAIADEAAKKAYAPVKAAASLSVKEGSFIASKPTGGLGVVKTFEIVVPKLVANGTKLSNANDELAEKNGSGGTDLIAAVLGSGIEPADTRCDPLDSLNRKIGTTKAISKIIAADPRTKGEYFRFENELHTGFLSLRMMNTAPTNIYKKAFLSKYRNAFESGGPPVRTSNYWLMFSQEGVWIVGETEHKNDLYNLYI